MSRSQTGPASDRRFGVGVIGCGSISAAWFAGLSRARWARAACCASQSGASAERASRQWRIPACSIDALLQRDDVDIALILAPTDAHDELVRMAVAAGKHVYVEKPLLADYSRAVELVAHVEASGLRMGVAPDTWLGAAHQAARALIDEQAVGPIIGGRIGMRGGGPIAWHPNPAAFYRADAGPFVDMGGYYIAQLVSLLGPIRTMDARGRTGDRMLRVQAGHAIGDPIAVDVSTTIEGSLEFASGPRIDLFFSWDEPDASEASITLHGTGGSLRLPDPNWFGGPLAIRREAGPWSEIALGDRAFGIPNMLDPDGLAVADYRGAGLDEMCLAIRQARPHLTSPALAVHTLDALTATMRSTVSRAPVDLVSTCDRPSPFAAFQTTEQDPPLLRPAG